MAQYWYEFGDLTPTKKPQGFSERNTFFPNLKMNISEINGSTYAEIDASAVDRDISNLPLFILDREFDEFELLARSIQRTYHGGNTLFNGGRGFGVCCPESISADSLPGSGLLLSISSSNDSTNHRVTRQYILPNVDTNAGSATPLPATPTTQDKAFRPVMTRIKVSKTQIFTRHWYEDAVEPDTWHLTYNHNFLGKKIYLGAPSANTKSVLIGYSFLSISTAMDSPLTSPLTRTRSGKLSKYYAGKTIKLCSPNSKKTYNTSVIQSDGSWSLIEIICETVTRFDVFIETDDGDIFVPNNLNGDGYFGGDFPNGIVTENNIPVQGIVRIILRDSFGKPSDGFVVDEVLADQDGTWRVENLNRSFRYDVVCRLHGYKDMIYSSVIPESM